MHSRLATRTILFLSGSGPAVPDLGQVTNVYDGLRTRIYTEQIPARLQCGRGLDSCVFRRAGLRTSISAARPDAQHARLAGKTKPEAHTWAPSQIPPEAPTSLSESGPSSRAKTSRSFTSPKYLHRDSAVLRPTSFPTLFTMSSGWEPLAQAFIRCLRSAKSQATGSLIGCVYWDVTSKTFPDCRFFCLQSVRCCSILLWSMLMHGFLGSETVFSALLYLRLH